jgi:hypothetical protein
MKINNRISATDPPGLVPMRRQRRNGRVRPPACGAVATALLTAGLLAGCGGGAHASSTTSFMSRAIAYSDCMRSHGVPDFPDPDSEGDIEITGEMGLDPSSPAFQAAERDCGPFPTRVNGDARAPAVPQRAEGRGMHPGKRRPQLPRPQAHQRSDRALLQPPSQPELTGIPEGGEEVRISSAVGAHRSRTPPLRRADDQHPHHPDPGPRRQRQRVVTDMIAVMLLVATVAACAASVGSRELAHSAESDNSHPRLLPAAQRPMRHLTQSRNQPCSQSSQPHAIRLPQLQRSRRTRRSLPLATSAHVTHRRRIGPTVARGAS